MEVNHESYINQGRPFSAFKLKSEEKLQMEDFETMTKQNGIGFTSKVCPGTHIFIVFIFLEIFVSIKLNPTNYSLFSCTCT